MATTNSIALTMKSQVTGGSKALTPTANIYTANNIYENAVVVTANTTNQHIANVRIPHSTLVALVIQAGDNLTIKTNSSSVPADTLPVTKTAGVMWVSDGIHANPLSADVTDLYVTNATGADVKLDMLALFN